MNWKTAIALVVLTLCSGTAVAGILDDTEDLKGTVIVAAGDVEGLRCPTYGKYDCDSWPDNLLRFRYDNVCITTDLTACGITCTGLLAISRDETPYFFSFERFGGGMKKHSARMIQCPNVY